MAGGIDLSRVLGDAAKAASAAQREARRTEVALGKAERSVSRRLEGMEQVERNLDRYYGDTLQKARDAMEQIMALLEGYAKTHHEWMPDTGATDASTIGFIAEATPKLIVGVLSAGMAYDVFLELARDGKWAWLWPAVEENLDEIRRIFEGIMA